MNCYDERVKQLGGRLSGRLRRTQPQSLSEAELAALEYALGEPLSEDYREFLKDYGGYSIGRFNFYGFMPDEALDLLDFHELYHQRDVMPAELVPIGVDLGGNHLCIAISGNNKGSIYFWRLQEATVPASYDNTDFVSSSFAAMLQSSYLLRV